MNKINYFLFPAVIILLISNIFLYSNLSKQNSGIKKDISNLRQEQINQQASQKENIENLQNLVTFNWKEYQNDQFGFSFKYPDYATICDDTVNHNKLTEIEKLELNLIISNNSEDSELNSCETGNTPKIYIIIKKNSNNYKTAEEAFNKEFTDINKSLKNNFNYLNIDKSNAYGGIISYDLPDPQFIREEGYGIIILLKNDYIMKFDTIVYDEIFNNMRHGNKPIFDTIISSFRLNSSGS